MKVLVLKSEEEVKLLKGILVNHQVMVLEEFPEGVPAEAGCLVSRQEQEDIMVENFLYRLEQK